jgi:hypothetical protein
MINVNGIEQNAVYPDIITIKTRLLNNEIWMGIKDTPTDTEWCAESSLSPYTAGSFANDFGNSYYAAKVLGSADTPVRDNRIAFDIYRIFVNEVSVNTPYLMRIVYGTGTQDEAVEDLQYTVLMTKFDDENPAISAAIPIDVQMPVILSGTKVWIQIKNETLNATMKFYIGLHEYTQE